MKKEIICIAKSKRFWCMSTILIWNTFFIEHLYEYIGGPIGILGKWNGFYQIAGFLGDIGNMITYTKNEAYTNFLSYGIYTDAIAQLAREFMDDLGEMFFICSFLIGAFLIQGKSKEKSFRGQCREIFIKYFAAIICSMILLMILTMVPFTLTFRMGSLSMSGSPIQFWYYLLTWIFPTVLIVYAMDILVGVVGKTWILTAFVHFIVMCIMLPSEVDGYPIYKFIIRFDGCSERFYLKMKEQIMINRITACIVAAVFIGLALWICQKQYCKSGKYKS